MKNIRQIQIVGHSAKYCPICFESVKVLEDKEKERETITDWEKIWIHEN